MRPQNCDNESSRLFDDMTESLVSRDDREKMRCRDDREEEGAGQAEILSRNDRPSSSRKKSL